MVHDTVQSPRTIENEPLRTLEEEFAVRQTEQTRFVQFGKRAVATLVTAVAVVSGASAAAEVAGDYVGSLETPAWAADQHIDPHVIGPNTKTDPAERFVRVAAGDTAPELAHNRHVPLNKVKKDNNRAHANLENLKQGDYLLITKERCPKGQEFAQPGDSIFNAYHETVEQFIADNPLSGGHVIAGECYATPNTRPGPKPSKHAKPKPSPSTSTTSSTVPVPTSITDSKNPLIKDMVAGKTTSAVFTVPKGTWVNEIAQTNAEITGEDPAVLREAIDIANELPPNELIHPGQIIALPDVSVKEANRIKDIITRRHQSRPAPVPAPAPPQARPTGPFSVNTNVLSNSGLNADQIDKLLAADSPAMARLGKNFDHIEEKYGENAFFTIAHAKIESTSGTSRIARQKNNLFGRNAYDSCPSTCALGSNNYATSVEEYGGFLKNDYLTAPGGPHIRGQIDKAGRWYSGGTSISNVFVHYSTAGQSEARSIAGIMNELYAKAKGLGLVKSK